MIDFFHYWSALFKPPLLGWAIGVQFVAIVMGIVLQFVNWKLRHYPLICVPLGALSGLILSVPLLILGWGLGGWDDWDNPAPPDFVDLTWLYFAGLETGLLLLALGTAFLHRKQFALPLLCGFSGFFLDGAIHILAFTYLGNTVISSRLNFSAPQDKVLAFYALSGLVLWLLFTFMRPTMLMVLKSLRLTWHPKADGLAQRARGDFPNF